MKSEVLLLLCAIMLLIPLGFAAAPTVAMPTISPSFTTDRNYMEFPIDINAIASGDVNGSSVCWYLITTSGTKYPATWVNDFNTCSIEGYSSAGTGDYNFSMIVQNNTEDANGTSPTAYYWRDNQAPTTTLNCSINATLSCVDTPLNSGCASTDYSVDGGAWQSGNSFSLLINESYSIDYNSTDALGNVEVTNTSTCDLVTDVDVNIDYYGRIINNSASIGENIIAGVASLGNLIGLVFGIGLVVVMLFGVIISLVVLIYVLVSEIKKVK